MNLNVIVYITPKRAYRRVYVSDIFSWDDTFLECGYNHEIIVR